MLGNKIYNFLTPCGLCHRGTSIFLTPCGLCRMVFTTVDNINKISKDASEGMKDFSTLRSNIDDTVKALDDVTREIDAIISKKKEPEIKVP